MRLVLSSSQLLFLIVFFLATPTIGCSTYSNAGSQFKERHSRLIVPLPQDWLQFNDAEGAFVLTKDGLRLEQVVIRAIEVGNEMEGTARVYQAGMLPNEIAELSLGLMEAEEETKNFEVKDIEATTIAGTDGYLAEAAFVDKSGLPKRAMICGAMFGEIVVELSYVAARDVYFEKYLPAYRKMLNTAHVETK